MSWSASHCRVMVVDTRHFVQHWLVQARQPGTLDNVMPRICTGSPSRTLPSVVSHEQVYSSQTVARIDSSQSSVSLLVRSNVDTRLARESGHEALSTYIRQSRLFSGGSVRVMSAALPSRCGDVADPSVHPVFHRNQETGHFSLPGKSHLTTIVAVCQS